MTMSSPISDYILVINKNLKIKCLNIIFAPHKKTHKKMITKKFLFATFIGATLLASCNQTTKTETENAAAVSDSITLNVDSTSTIEWKGSMLKMYSHTGTMNLVSGNFTVKGGKIATGKFEASFKTLAPTDSNYEATGQRTKANLIGHLSSPDFFDVANNPTASFQISSGSDDGKTLKGMLTVRGKSNEENVENVAYDAATKTATGTLKFNRQNYGVAYKATMKDMVLSDDIELTISLKGK
jgi:polyisoprenoid-binding protein YceI